MGIFEAVIQGIVQGVTEFLPVSSSGHLLIAQHILGVKDNNLFFNVMLHIGTLVAVIAVYYKEIFKLICAFFKMISKMIKREFSLKSMDAYEQMVLMIIIGLLPLFMLFLPVIGTCMNVKDIATDLSCESNILIVGLALIFTSFLIRKGIKTKTCVKFIANQSKEEIISGKERVGFMDAISIGVMQLVAAIFPGISRSGSTLSVGLMRGISKKVALDYSFILGIPAILAAAVLEFKEVIEKDLFSSVDIVPLITGVIVSGVVGFLSIKLFKWLLKTDKMMIFVVYTFVVGAFAVGIGIFERIRGVNIFTGIPI